MITLLTPVAGFVWLACAWIFLIAVLLKRWYERERHDAAETKKVLKRLKYDTTHDHIFDGA